LFYAYEELQFQLDFFKFLFVKYISLEFQGEYSLLLTTITIMTLIVGLDFYVYSNRYLIKNRSKTEFSILNQFVFHLLSYSVLFLIFLILNYFDVYSKYFTILILILIILEHIGTEFFRIFIALEKALIANILLFLRTGTWPLILIYQLLFTDIEITIKSVVLYWVLASVLTVVISFLFIFKELRSLKFNINKKWIMKGLNVGIIFFSATIGQKIIEYSDRYIIDSIMGAKSLGIYTFYFQLANLANVAIFTIIISFLYPRIIHFIELKDRKNTFASLKKLQNKSVLFIITYAIIITTVLPYLLELIGKPELENHKIILVLFLLGNLFINLSLGYHYLLMGLEKDKLLMKIGLKIAALNILANLFGVFYLGIKGAVIVFVISSFLIFILKKKAAKNYFTKYDWKN